MASMCGGPLKYLTNGFTMLEMTYEIYKLLKYVGNDVYIWEMAQVFQKLLKYVGSDVDLWEMAQICREMTYLFDKRFKNVEND